MFKKIPSQLCINGTWVDGQGPSFFSTDPGNGDLVMEGRAASQDQVLQAVAAAKSGFSSWKKTAFEDRCKIILRFASLVDVHKQELALLISQEMGKPLWDALTEVQALGRKAEVSIKAYQERCKTSAIQDLHISHRPFGPVAVLGPYNFPAHLPHGQIIPALLAANTVVFKPSEWTPAVGAACMLLWQKAGLPDGALQLIHGDGRIGSALIDNPELKGIYFTGSAPTGKAIEAHSLQFPHRMCALEMGGNNPLIVSRTDNTEAAVFIAIQSAFITTGQRCSCARRLIVIDGQDSFLDELASQTKKLRIGHYKATPEPYMGPLVSSQAACAVLAKYQDIVQKFPMAQVLSPMEQAHPESAFLTPGIIDVTGCKAPDVEIFGPLLQVIRVANIDDAISEANNTLYGLTAGIITDDEDEARMAVSELEAGIINCNSPLTGASGLAPFGGIKDSGNLRPAGYYACDFTAYPVASMIYAKPQLPEILPKGLQNE